MQESRLADIKVGIFVLASLLILVVGSLWIAGSTLFGSKRVSYQVLMPNSSGVKSGDRVRFAGVAVGRIQQISLRPGDEMPVVFHIAVRRDVPVKIDSLAKISSAGLLGNPFLELVAGSPDAPDLPAGSEIVGMGALGLDQALARVDELSLSATRLIDQTSGVLDKISNEIGPIMVNLERLTSEENGQNIESLLASLNKTMTEAGPRLSELLVTLQSSGEKLEAGLDDVPELTARVSGLVDSLQSALGPDGARLSSLLDTAHGALDSADGAMSMVGDQRDEIAAMLEDLRDTTANLKAFSQHIKEHPYSLVRIKPPPDRQPGEGVGKDSP